MAVLSDNGTLTPVPTRVESGNIIVLLSDDAILVPLAVSVTFNDLQQVVAHVRTEIGKAASLMIIEGFPDGSFRPGTNVNVQQAVTMFLRAAGVPVEWATY